MSLQAANYTAQRVNVEGREVIRLGDAARDTQVLIIPSLGNNAYSMRVKGHEIMWSPYQTIAEWEAKPAQRGNPFLAPWCNRIDGDGYWANGKRYQLNDSLGNFRRDANKLPIHGLLTHAPWTVTAVSSSADGAVTTSRLEFWKQPEWMEQFPFAHTLEMTHRLRDGVLEVETVIHNHSVEPLPLSIGYHTYYQLTDSARDDWKVHVAASERVELSPLLLPTGAKSPTALADPYPLRGTQLDDVFTSLTRGPDGRAVFYVQGAKQRLAVEYGAKYPVAVIYAPPGRGFICFEPMTGVTNIFNLGHAGQFPLQSVPPGSEWRESFWIRPSGF